MDEVVCLMTLLVKTVKQDIQIMTNGRLGIRLTFPIDLGISECPVIMRFCPTSLDNLKYV